MGLQNLAIIFVIIVLPMTLILTAYTQNMTDTLDLQIEYDRRLRKSTYDALKAFQLNTINSDTSDLANSKLRDIEASVNTFFNSIATNFNMAGYNKDILKEYIPAIVYTMYDGYYIYSPYYNKLDETKDNEVIVNNETKLQSDADILSEENTNATYHDGERLNGLKPYIYYSCRYKFNADDDFVITYSLDNYITIQGRINGKWVNDAGYLLDNISGTGTNITYRGIKIDTEVNSEYVYDPDEQKTISYRFIKLNGVKYYYDGSKWFSILNGMKLTQDNLNLDKTTTAAIKYYEDAQKFKNRIINDYKLSELKTSNAVDEKGASLYELDEDGNQTDKPKFGNYKIFDFGGMSEIEGSIEDPDSYFNMHRLAVIRYCIEKELSIAIANYNKYTDATYTNFQMPELDENDWNSISDNISIITFLQGLSIGGKLYNGYSVVMNNKNEELVQENSIYLLTNDYEYHRPNDVNLANLNILKGYFNIDFEIKSAINNDGETIKYMPQMNIVSGQPAIIGNYSSIVDMSNVASVENYYDYIAKTAEGAKPDTLAQKYFTALGRERYGQYRTNNNAAELKKEFM